MLSPLSVVARPLDWFPATPSRIGFRASRTTCRTMLRSRPRRGLRRRSLRARAVSRRAQPSLAPVGAGSNGHASSGVDDNLAASLAASFAARGVESDVRPAAQNLADLVVRAMAREQDSEGSTSRGFPEDQHRSSNALSATSFRRRTAAHRRATKKKKLLTDAGGAVALAFAIEEYESFGKSPADRGVPASSAVPSPRNCLLAARRFGFSTV